MRAPPAFAPLFCLALVACTPGRGAGDTSSSSSSAQGGAPEVDACSPSKLGLGDAKPVARWSPPPGCTLRGGGGGTTFVHTAEQLGASVECTGAAPGVDLTSNVLVVAWRSISPAQVGTDVLDDGKTITFVSRQRSPCPNDPLPMPMTAPLSFLLPAGATRDVKEASCSLPPSCK